MCNPKNIAFVFAVGWRSVLAYAGMLRSRKHSQIFTHSRRGEAFFPVSWIVFSLFSAFETYLEPSQISIIELFWESN